MKKYLSDIDTINGKPAVEWEWESGGRTWEEFDTEEERSAAIEANELELGLEDEEADNREHYDEAKAMAEQAQYWEDNYLADLEQERFDYYDSLYY